MALSIKSKTPKKEYKPLEIGECLAKSGTEIGRKGCTVEEHLRATYFCAEAIWRFLAEYRCGNLFEKQDLIAPLLHDIGKFSPVFQDKIYRACGLSVRELYGKMYENSSDTKYEVDHATAGFATFSALREKTEGEKDLENLSYVVGHHHGFPCRGSVSAKSEQLGGAVWQDLREKEAETLCREFDFTLEEGISGDADRLQLVLGLTILADWLSSGMELEYGERVTQEKASETVKNAGFVPFRIKKGMRFGEVFRGKDGTEFLPNRVQMGMAETIQPGGVYIVEAEMGYGKTEAALFLAYKLLAEHQHRGVYFALPTRLTSDKIHERFQPFLENILEEGEHRETLLLHGKNLLKNKLSMPTEEGEEDGNAENADIDAWFNAKKRGLLAPFAVGTVDQALLAVLNVKHNALRALGLAGKVVILDEIHSYDAYTGKLIQDLVRKLRQWGCTVILLSATLTKKMKRELLGLTEERKCAETENKNETGTEAYPMLSVLGKGGKLQQLELTEKEKAEKIVEIRHSNSAEESLRNALKHAERGESVLWIENTVGDAQKVYSWFQENLAGMGETAKIVKIGLIHSRFLAGERQEKEKEWTELYGKDVTPEERTRCGRILVGTQVLEQSVDLDADYLVTRLCPADMLLQRIGRLWRHAHFNPFRPAEARRVTEILNEKLTVNREVPKKEEAEREEKAYLPYAAYVIARTQEIFENCETVSIPRDLRPILEMVYAERKEENGTLFGFWKEFLNKRKKDMTFQADLNQGRAVTTGNDDENRATTRYGMEPEVEILLLDVDAPSGIIRPYGSPETIQIPPKNARKEERTKCACQLNEYLVRVREKFTPEFKSGTWEEGELERLSHVLYTGYGDYRPLRVAYVSAEDGRLRDSAGNPLFTREKGEELYYNELGFRTQNSCHFL